VVGDDGYNCMGRYDLHDRLKASVLACPCELAEVQAKMSGLKSLSTGSVPKCRVW